MVMIAKVETVAIAVAAVIGMVATIMIIVELVVVLLTVSSSYTHSISSNDSNNNSCSYNNDDSDYHTKKDSNNDRDNIVKVNNTSFSNCTTLAPLDHYLSLSRHRGNCFTQCTCS